MKWLLTFFYQRIHAMVTMKRQTLTIQGQDLEIPVEKKKDSKSLLNGRGSKKTKVAK